MLSKNVCWKCELHYFGKNYVPASIQKNYVPGFTPNALLTLFYLIYYELGPTIICFKEES